MKLRGYIAEKLHQDESRSAGGEHTEDASRDTQERTAKLTDKRERQTDGQPEGGTEGQTSDEQTGRGGAHW
ncbi:hypothetical protein E2C01_096502 [Portunus trituberculatus]|uniref:Uncharacterized protein n=1 Tax=Portunus trituberculatus TaxID=210409 RepID=A0A5B7JSQ8_PORTR|nr:hypothetical protein [Portunus trituberculatus]